MEDVQILELGPYEVVGPNYIGKNEAGEIPRLWTEQCGALFAQASPGVGCFGICRCIPGQTDGTFEYIAAVQPREGAPVDPSWKRVFIPRTSYAVFGVANLSQVKAVWEDAARRVSELAQWASYCGKDGCDCATHPCFEYYPASFNDKSRLEILIPLKWRG